MRRSLHSRRPADAERCVSAIVLRSLGNQTGEGMQPGQGQPGISAFLMARFAAGGDGYALDAAPRNVAVNSLYVRELNRRL